MAQVKALLLLPIIPIWLPIRLILDAQSEAFAGSLTLPIMIASALLGVAGADGAPQELRSHAPEITDALPHGMGALGTWVDGEYARTTCCLWFKTPSAKGGYCADCSFLTRH